MTAQSDAIIAIHMSKSKRQMGELSALNILCIMKIGFCVVLHVYPGL